MTAGARLLLGLRMGSLVNSLEASSVFSSETAGREGFSSFSSVCWLLSASMISLSRSEGFSSGAFSRAFSGSLSSVFSSFADSSFSELPVSVSASFENASRKSCSSPLLFKISYSLMTSLTNLSRSSPESFFRWSSRSSLFTRGSSDNICSSLDSLSSGI